MHAQRSARGAGYVRAERLGGWSTGCGLEGSAAPLLGVDGPPSTPALPQGLGSSHVRPTGHAGISRAITIWAGYFDRSTAMGSGRKPVLCI